MLKKFTLMVTEEQTLNGEVRSNNKCPLALAINEAFCTSIVHSGTRVYHDCAFVTGKDGQSRNIDVPLEWESFIRMNDFDRTPNPQSFVLEVSFPDELMLAAIEAYEKKCSVSLQSTGDAT